MQEHFIQKHYSHLLLNLPPFPLNRKERIRDSGISQIVRNAKEMSKEKGKVSISLPYFDSWIIL